MLKKTITYVDFNDEERTETFYFNLTKTELAKLENNHSGGLTEWLTRAIEKKDGKVLIETFEELIKACYGVKSPDGKTFIKNEAVYSEFVGTNAYDQLFMELVTSADNAAQFLIDCLPKDVREEAIKARNELVEKENTKITAVNKE